jgi:AP-1 complex subunit sigma 1/2
LFKQVVYKRYASLFFCFAVDRTDNELIALEIIHRYVEVLDQYFGSVCELVI